MYSSLIQLLYFKHIDVWQLQEEVASYDHRYLKGDSGQTFMPHLYILVLFRVFPNIFPKMAEECYLLFHIYGLV